MEFSSVIYFYSCFILKAIDVFKTLADKLPWQIREIREIWVCLRCRTSSCPLSAVFHQKHIVSFLYDTSLEKIEKLEKDL